MTAALFLADLERKPATLRALADALDADALSWPVQRPPASNTSVTSVTSVTLLGMGSSLSAAQVAALRMRVAGITAVAESGAAEAVRTGGPDDLDVGISASGASVETNRLFALSTAGRRIALTNTIGSDITTFATDVVDLRAEPETSGVACRSYTHTLVALLALEHALAGTVPDLAGRVRRAADATADLLEHRADWLPATVELLDGPHGSWVLAPLERLSSATQSALMLRECPRRASVGCETGDWSHVDVYLTKTLDYRALVCTGSRWDAPAAAWLVERGSTVVAVGGDFDGARHTVRYPGDDDPVVALLTETLIAELTAATLWAAAD